jgi:hypothetical protein
LRTNNFLFVHRLFLFLSIVYIGGAVLLLIIFGPIETEIFGNKVSFISLVNPIRISLGLFFLSLIFKALETYKEQSAFTGLLRRLWMIIKTGGIKGDDRLTGLSIPTSRSGRWIEVLCLGITFWSIFFFIRLYSTDVAGGSDSYGYVSEAVRLSHGRLYESENVFSLFGLPENAERTHPLGYIEKGDQGTVPIYPFGYPLIMAAFIKVFGLHGAYWVTPLLAAGTILLTYWLGRACIGRPGGVIAAGFVLFLPNFLFSSFSPMSDVPATFFSVLVLVSLLVLRPSPLADLFLGASLGFGVWVRPNMILLVLPVIVWFVIRKEWLRLLRFSLGISPFILVEGLVNGYLYGSPWRTGYGTIHTSESFSNMLDRGIRHLMRLHDQQADLGLFLLILGLLLGRLSFNRRLLLVCILLVFLGFFAWYPIDDTWWYFRFLLPAMPAVAVLETSFLLHFISTGQLKRWHIALLMSGFAVFAWNSINYADTNLVFELQKGEAKFPKAAQMVIRHVKLPALILARQHSGSLRFYTGIPTTRCDLTSGKGHLEKIQTIKKAGGHVYLLLDHSEFQKIANTNRNVLLTYGRLVATINPDKAEKVWLFELNVPVSS